MHASCRREEDVSWPKRLSTIATHVFTRACGDKVDLIARVWFLWIGSSWRVDLDQQAAMLEHGREALAIGPRQTLERLSYRSADTRVI